MRRGMCLTVCLGSIATGAQRLVLEQTEGEGMSVESLMETMCSQKSLKRLDIGGRQLLVWDRIIE